MSQSEGSRRPIRTVIVDKSPLVLLGLAHILAETRFRICFECHDLQDLPKTAIRDGQPSLLLIGIGIDAERNLAWIENLKKQHNHLLVVVLAEGSGQQHFFLAIEAGADGYLTKSNISTDTLLKTLDLVMSRTGVIPLELMGSMKDRVRDQSVIDVDVRIGISEQPIGQLAPNVQECSAVALSKREELILRHLMQGAPNKQIARELAVAEATVKVHVKALLRKIRVRNRTQAAMWAIGKGFRESADPTDRAA